MILSFSVTCKLAAQKNMPEPIKAGIKTCTRRRWKEKQAQQWINAYYDGRLIHQAWSNAPYVAGAKRLGYIQLSCCPYPEALKNMPEYDLLREGGFWESRRHFILEIGDGNEDLIVWVIRWNQFFL